MSLDKVKDELVQEATQNAVKKVTSWLKSQLFGRKEERSKPSMYSVVTVTYETAIRNVAIETECKADALSVYEMVCNANKNVQVYYLVDGVIEKSRVEIDL